MSDIVIVAIITLIGTIVSIVVGQGIQVWREKREEARSGPKAKADYAKTLREIANDAVTDYNNLLGIVDAQKADHTREVNELREQIALILEGHLHIELDVYGNPPIATVTKAEYRMPQPVGVKVSPEPVTSRPKPRNK